MSKRLTTREFCNKANIKHGNKYDYSLVNYVNSSTKVNIICSMHGEFCQVANDHLQGYGCPTCGGTTRSTNEQFIKKAIAIHGTMFDYTLVNYIDFRTKVKIICKKHGVFQASPCAHLIAKHKCPKCGTEHRVGRNDQAKIGTKSFVERASLIHNNKYNYEPTQYVDAHTLICINCPVHGEFMQTPANHLWNKTGCARCAKEYEHTKLTYSKAYFEKNPQEQHIPGTLYLLKFSTEGETFVKIGITKNAVSKRFYTRHKKYLIDILLSKSMSIYQAFILEQDIIKDLHQYKYIPSIKFGGMSECFKYTNDIVDKIREKYYGNIP